MTVAASAGVLGGGPAAAEPVVAPTVAAAPAKGSAVDDLAACVAGRKAASVVFLIDESKSLQTTDPNAARVTAAAYLADQWAALSAQTSAEISLSVIGFGQSTEQVLGWTPVTSATKSTVDGALASLRDRNTGTGTDYWLGLDQARQALATKPGHTAADCQAVVWFSDGKLDTDATYETSAGRVRKPYVASGTDSPDVATAAARKDLCRAGGLADQIRGSNIVTFAVGLQVDTAPAEFDLMKGIATASPVDGSSCGQTTQPVPGEFHLATDIDGLLFLFDKLIRPGTPTIDEQLKVCQGQVCASETHHFVLDASIGGVHLLGTAGLDHADAVLIAPGGAPVTLPRLAPGTSTSLTVGSATVAVAWLSARTLALDLAPKARDAGWSGQWGLVFVDKASTSADAVSRTSLDVSADIVPTLKAPPPAPVHAGEKSPPVTFGLATSKGAEIDPASLLGTVQFSAQVVDSAETTISVLTDADKTTLGIPTPLDLTMAAPGAATVRLVLNLTTATATLADGRTVAGTALTPAAVDVPLTVAPPVGYPGVTGGLDFGSIEGVPDVSRQLTVTGPGCVWIQDASVKVVGSPTEAGNVTLTSDASAPPSCLSVDSGSQKPLSVRLKADGPANGAITGTVTLMTSPQGEPGRAKPVVLPFQAALAKPPNATAGELAFAMALVVGIGVPLLLLYGVKWRSAKIPPLALQAETFPVTVTGDTVLREGAPFDLGPRDLRAVVPIPPRGGRDLQVDGVSLHARTGLSPFGPGDVRVSRPGSRVASATAGTGTHEYATLPLAVHNHWVLLKDDATGAASVLVLVGQDPRGDVRQSLASEVREKAPGRWTALGGTGEAGTSNDPFSAPGGDSSQDPWGAGRSDPWDEGAETPKAPSRGPSGPTRTTSPDPSADERDPFAASDNSPAQTPGGSSASPERKDQGPPDFSSWSWDDPS